MLLIAGLPKVINQNRVDNDRTHRRTSSLLRRSFTYSLNMDICGTRLSNGHRLCIRLNHIKCDPFDSKHTFLSYVCPLHCVLVCVCVCVFVL